jgi:hypothetical protein
MGNPRTWCGSTARGNKSCFVRSGAITARCYDSYGAPQIAAAVVARILWGEAPTGLHAIRDDSISLGTRGFRSAQEVQDASRLGCEIWSREKIQLRRCQGRRASAFSQRHRVVPLIFATKLAPPLPVGYRRWIVARAGGPNDEKALKLGPLLA